MKALLECNDCNNQTHTAKITNQNVFPDAVITQHFGYLYTLTSPIHMSSLKTLSAYRDPPLPAIQENHLETMDSKMINSMLTIAICGDL